MKVRAALSRCPVNKPETMHLPDGDTDLESPCDGTGAHSLAPPPLDDIEMEALRDECGDLDDAALAKRFRDLQAARADKRDKDNNKKVEKKGVG